MKNLNKLKSTIAIIVAYSLILSAVAFLVACPKKDAVRKAIEASYRLPAATNDIIAQVTTARDTGIITIDQARAFGDALNKMANAEVVYIGLVKALQNTIETTGTADPGKLREIQIYFDTAIIEPFLRVLELARVLSGDSVKLILLAITAARLLIRSIGSGIGSSKTNTLSGPATVPGLIFYQRGVNYGI